LVADISGETPEQEQLLEVKLGPARCNSRVIGRQLTLLHEQVVVSSTCNRPWQGVSVGFLHQLIPVE